MTRSFALVSPAQASAMTVAVAATDKPSSERAKEFKLSNGLDVVVIPDHRAPVVTHMVWYKVGAADEPAGARASRTSSST